MDISKFDLKTDPMIQKIIDSIAPPLESEFVSSKPKLELEPYY